MNGATPGISFSHNLNAIFPPLEYIWHPEFFPLVEGERLQPPRGSYFWQPDLGREDVAAWAVEAAWRHFQAHPDAVSFAVGVNDGLIFGESEETLKLIQSRKQKAEILGKNGKQKAESGDPELKIDWFRQRPDFTDLVYTFTNRVAREVAATHPDKYVGALAYYWCENAPSFPLEPNVIPFLTADRSQGYDERFREEERQLQRAWACAHGMNGPRSTRTARNAADEGVRAPTLLRRLGLYDYLYGKGYLVPRVHTRLIADNLRQAWRLGFTDYFAELNPNWGLDGPMAWMVAQLLQDPEQSREVLLEEYYSRYFREAAVPMRRFFERCEYQWMTQPGPAYWLKHYRNESQARLFPSAVCRELRALLDAAARQARAEITKKRVAFVSDTFGVTERFVEFCEARDELNRAVLRAAASRLDLQEANRGQAELRPQSIEPAADHTSFEKAESRKLKAETLKADEPVEQEANRGQAEVGRKEAQKAQGLEKAESRKLKTETGAVAAEPRGSAVRRSSGDTVKPLGGEAVGAAMGSASQPHGGTASLQKADGGVRAPKELSARFLEARAEFVTYTMALMEREPQALAPFVWADYLRHEPPLLRSDEWRKAESGKQKADGARQRGEGHAAGVARSEAEGAASGRPLGQRAAQSRRQDTKADLVAKAMATVVADTGASQPQAFNLPASRRVKPFTEFRDLTAGPIVPAWTVGGLRYGVALPEGWQSYVEPSEFQSAELRDGVLRLTGNKETFVYQWVPASGDAAYRARVRVRGRVEPSTTVILALSWLDAGQRRLGSTIHRLPEGEWPGWVTLEVTQYAPEKTAWVGVGLRVQNQMPRDWTEARAFTLERLEEPLKR